MYDLIGIIDIPDRSEKIRKTKETFSIYKQKIECLYESRVSDIRKKYEEKLSMVGAYLIAPNPPMLNFTINHELLEQKVKGRLTLQSLEDEIINLPEIGTFNYFAAVLGVLLSAVANFITLNIKLGNDWIGGNEVISTAVNGLFSLVLMLFEATGFYLLMYFLPRRASNGLVRIVGIIGAIMVVVAICIIVFTRAEIGTTEITNVQDIGRVE